MTTEIKFADGANLDAFGRLRVSQPETLFDSKNCFNDSGIPANQENQPLFYDNQQISGAGTFTEYRANRACQALGVSGYTAGRRTRQTKRRFNYQPGKSLQAISSFVFGAQSAGITQREGLFDDQNGLFLEDDGTTYNLVVRTYESGEAVDNKIARADWNVDKFDGTGPSGITLDFTKTQILVIDYEWLGVGRVRFGFFCNGCLQFAHYTNHNNVLDRVYMSTPNAPLRSEIINDGTGPATVMTQICSTVVSEGAQNPLGSVRYVSTAGTHMTATSENVAYVVAALRLKSAYLGTTVDLLETNVFVQSSSDSIELFVVFNPTVAGSLTWVANANSATEYALGVSANVATGGYLFGGGYSSTGRANVYGHGLTSSQLANAIRLGSKIDGTRDVIALCARPIAGSSGVEIEGSITWRELV